MKNKNKTIKGWALFVCWVGTEKVFDSAHKSKDLAQDVGNEAMKYKANSFEVVPVEIKILSKKRK